MASLRKSAPDKKATKKPAKRGRPSSYTEALADRICEKLAAGAAMNHICLEAKMPSESMVYRWLESNEAFREKYARARLRAADMFAAEVISIADGADGSTIRGIEHARLRLDARKWATSKLAPKKYGDRLDVGNADSKPFETADSTAKLADLLNKIRPIG